MGYTYATLLVLGYIGRVGLGDCGEVDYSNMLDLLLCFGAPVDSQDIIGRTTLHHAANWTGICGLTKVLLKHKANVNLQDRFGASPLLAAIQQHTIDVIPVLLDAGANLDVTDGEGSSPRSMYPTRPIDVSNTVKDWLVKHEGKGSVLQGDRCSKCGTRSVSVKRCARCRSRLYCSPECQSELTGPTLNHLIPLTTPHRIKETDWKVHKKSCQPFDKEGNLLVVTPSYSFGEVGDRVSTLLMIPIASEKKRGPILTNERFETNVPDGRNMVLKIQLPLAEGGMLVYNKKRSFECFLDFDKNPAAYTRIEKIIKEKGILGLKAYFAAELRSKDELAINIAECLPESRF